MLFSLQGRRVFPQAKKTTLPLILKVGMLVVNKTYSGQP